MKQQTSNGETVMQTTLFDVGEWHLPVLPYGGTSGWSGSETSRDRAVTADKSGKTGKNQQEVLQQLELARGRGVTWQELSDATGWHHGTASGALSVLHKTGLITRLKDKRGKCAIYVLPDFVQDRETETHKPNVSARLLMEILDELEHDLANGFTTTALARIRATREAMQ